jgi:serine protease Do
LVLRVVRDSPAERGGLRSGDVVLGIDGQRDASYEQLQQDVAAARPGQTLALNVWRRGAMQRIVLTVGEAPADMPVRGQPVPNPREERLGLSLGELSAARRDRLGVDGGVSVLEVHGTASLGGVLADDLIVGIGDRPVRDVAAFDAALAAAPADRPIALLVLRAGTLAFLAIDRTH